MTHTYTRTHALLRERVIEIRKLPFVIRVWRQAEDLDTPSERFDDTDLHRAIHDEYRRDECTALKIAKTLVLRTDVNAVEVILLDGRGAKQHGEVLYKDWP